MERRSITQAAAIRSSGVCALCEFVLYVHTECRAMLHVYMYKNAAESRAARRRDVISQSPKPFAPNFPSADAACALCGRRHRQQTQTRRFLPLSKTSAASTRAHLFCKHRRMHVTSTHSLNIGCTLLIRFNLLFSKMHFSTATIIFVILHSESILFQLFLLAPKASFELSF